MSIIINKKTIKGFPHFSMFSQHLYADINAVEIETKHCNMFTYK